MAARKALETRFVDRQDEIVLVERMVEEIYYERRFPRQPLVNVVGIAGIGKSRLLNQLHDRLKNRGVACSFIDFANERYRPPERGQIEILSDIVAEMDRRAIDFREELGQFDNILEQTRDESGEYKIDEASRFRRREQSNRVVNAFTAYTNELTEKGPVALFFDTAHEASIEIGQDEKGRPITFLDQLENTVLSQLVVMDGVIIIVASRSPLYWKRFEVRCRAFPYRLLPFSIEDTREQLPGYSELVPHIFQLTFGHPLANIRLVEELQAIERREKRAVDESTLERYRGQLIELMDALIEQYVMRDISPELKRAFRMIAVLRQFDVNALRYILSQFVPEPFSDKGGAYFLSLIGKMVETTLVQWDPAKKGYSLDDTMRKMLALSMRLRNRDLYERVNAAAIKLYGDWIERVSENPSRFIIEKLYHRANLLRDWKTGLEIGSELKGELQEYLERFYRDEVYGIPAAMELLEELKRDQELEGGIREGFPILTETVDRLIASAK